MIVYQREVPGEEYREERGNNHDKHPADIRDDRQDRRNECIDDADNGDYEKGYEVRNPADGPDGRKNCRNVNPFKDAARPGKADRTEDPEQQDAYEEYDLHKNKEQQDTQEGPVHRSSRGSNEECDCKGGYGGQYDKEGQDPEEPYDREFDAIDKQFRPLIEVGSRFCPPVYPDHIAREEEREDNAKQNEECDLGPRDCFPVELCTVQ